MAQLKRAVIIFNLGGPDSLGSVKPFLYNLFNDPAIIRLPSPLRQFVAWLISTRREKTAQEIYSLIGGRSPIVEETEKQVQALEQSLNNSGSEYKVFQCQRYWHPKTEEVVEKVKNFRPDEIILLPLYPQYSTTTTESSFKEWELHAKKLNIKTKAICCYPVNDDFIRSHSYLLKNELNNSENVKVIFSAHGLPQKIVDAGDPYQVHVEQTVAAILNNVPVDDYVISYQSRVGPVAWIKPYTDDEIVKAASEGKSIIIVPVAFVSEHSETLVELGIEYRKRAMENGAKEYKVVPTLGTHDDYIISLKNMVINAVDNPGFICNKRNCSPAFKQCPNNQG